MKLETGLLGYIDKYWRGFFPILIVELFKEKDEFHISTPQNEPPSEEYLKLQTQLTQLFGEVHIIGYCYFTDTHRKTNFQSSKVKKFEF